MFDEALCRDLQAYRKLHPEVTLLQYVDDLLLAAHDARERETAFKDLLEELARLKYKVSAKKAQVCLPTVMYLGYQIQDGR